MRLPRMTTRRWMVAVAIAAVGIGTWILIDRSRSYAALSAFHAESEKECWRIVEAFDGSRFDPVIWGEALALVRRSRRLLIMRRSGASTNGPRVAPGSPSSSTRRSPDKSAGPRKKVQGPKKVQSQWPGQKW
jgi:hypothetical protein